MAAKNEIWNSLKTYYQNIKKVLVLSNTHGSVSYKLGKIVEMIFFANSYLPKKQKHDRRFLEELSFFHARRNISRVFLPIDFFM